MLDCQTVLQGETILLDELEARVLGSLMEKEATTPDYYPLSLNALVHACNQKSSREPVMNLDENTVRDALRSLNRKGLAGETSSAESRVTKYEHRIGESMNLGRPESALLCVLLLRGAQTPGELRGRSERLYRFEDLDQVQHGLERLLRREPPLIIALPRQPGSKEVRYVHLLCGDPPADMAAANLEPSAEDRSTEADRIARLQLEVAMLQQQVASLEQQFADFRKQFE